MTARSATTRLLFVGSVVILALVFVAAQQTTAPYGRVPKGKYKKFVSPIGGFELEYPDSKDWKVVPGHPDTVMTMVDTRTGKAAIIVERITLRAALTPDEISASANDEVRTLRQRQPEATNIQQGVQDADGRRFITVQYVRPGLQGPEQVIVYTFPLGTTMYRLMTSAVQSDYSKFAPVFGHMAATFRPAQAAAPSPKPKNDTP
jgi:hypothetical protein